MGWIKSLKKWLNEPVTASNVMHPTVREYLDSVGKRLEDLSIAEIDTEMKNRFLVLWEAHSHKLTWQDINYTEYASKGWHHRIRFDMYDVWFTLPRGKEDYRLMNVDVGGKTILNYLRDRELAFEITERFLILKANEDAAIRLKRKMAEEVAYRAKIAQY